MYRLSQLHNVGHSKDVNLKDDREHRHNQQMSLLAHKDALNALPPEVTAQLVNAKYTICTYLINVIKLNRFVIFS